MAGGNTIPSVYCLIDETLGAATFDNGFSVPKNMQVSTPWMSLYAAKLVVITQICCLEMYAPHLTSASNIHRYTAHSVPCQDCCTCRFWLWFSNKSATMCSSNLISYLTWKKAFFMSAMCCQQAEASVSWTSDNQIKSDSSLCGNVTDRDDGKPKPL